MAKKAIEKKAAEKKTASIYNRKNENGETILPGFFEDYGGYAIRPVDPPAKTKSTGAKKKPTTNSKKK